ncbi:MAG: hypothetical protein AB1568_13575 [Thermodesulfobacteriota bacterium]
MEHSVKKPATTAAIIIPKQAFLLLLFSFFFLIPSGLRSLQAAEDVCRVRPGACPCCAGSGSVMPASHHEPAGDGDGDGGCCGFGSPCGDIGLPEAPALHRPRPAGVLSQQLPAPAPAMVVPPCRQATGAALAVSRHPHPFPRSSLLQQRTVVLLI